MRTPENPLAQVRQRTWHVGAGSVPSALIIIAGARRVGGRADVQNSADAGARVKESPQ